MTNTRIFGYADPLCARAGSKVDFMISVEGRDDEEEDDVGRACRGGGVRGCGECERGGGGGERRLRLNGSRKSVNADDASMGGGNEI